MAPIAPPASLEALLARLEASIAGGGDWVNDCRADFHAFLADARAFAAARLEAVLAQLVRDPQHQSRDWDMKQVVLAEGASYVLLCSLYDEPMEHIYTSSFQALIGVLGPGTLTCKRYLLPSQRDVSVLESDKALTFAGTRMLRPLDSLRLDGRIEAYDFRSGEPTILVRLFRESTDALHHIYDRHSLRPWMVQAGDPASTQIVCLAGALGTLGASSALPVLEKASCHPHHFVRWAAIQAISALDVEAALGRLRVALADRHPDIRGAAARSLARAAAMRAEN